MGNFKPPLAERMRPKKMDEIVGQTHLVGPQGILRKLVETKTLRSMIFYGEPGCGKTTLARCLAKETNSSFECLSATEVGIKEIKLLLEKHRSLFQPNPPVLFLDEIHRFNKTQQDFLLGPVEKGQLILMGATTENPSFAIQNALLSRVDVFLLKPLNPHELQILLERALQQDVVLKQKKIFLKEPQALIKRSGGDARILLNLLETIVFLQKEPIYIDENTVSTLEQEKPWLYDKQGNQHYDLISAFIKSLRGSSPDAALYYLSRMLLAGEDPLFIARRMLIFAAEDIGNASPFAVVLANNTMEAVSKIGMPEARIILAQAVTYLAACEKSNAAYTAIEDALAFVKKTGDLPVPKKLRNAPTAFMKQAGYGEGYQYPHDHGGFVKENYFPEGCQAPRFYKPKAIGQEAKILERLKKLWGGDAN